MSVLYEFFKIGGSESMSENFKIEIEIKPEAYKKIDELAQKAHITPDILLTQIIIGFLNKEFPTSGFDFREVRE